MAQADRTIPDPRSWLASAAALLSPAEGPMSLINLRHGIFLPPFHPMEENPTACLDRDLELIEWLDRLGYHEAWIGEHHSAGFETISSRSEEHTSELQSRRDLVCRLLL